MFDTATGEAMNVYVPERLTWAHEGVFNRLQEAAETIKAMPLTGCFPATLRSGMPETIQRMQDWYPQLGSQTFSEEWRHVQERIADERHHVRTPPSAAAITRMEEAVRWRRYVTEIAHWRCLWAWAAGVRTVLVAKRHKISRPTARAWRRDALDRVVWGLNGF